MGDSEPMEDQKGSVPDFLVPQITVVIHPIDRNVHPTYPEGWRWAVMAGVTRPDDLAYCMGAGYGSDRTAASVEGEGHGAIAVRSLRTYGCPAAYAVMVLDYDPLPVEADHVPLPRVGV